jgi:cytidylate kinase
MNILQNYLEQRHKDKGQEKNLEPGPVVTISREFGCSGKYLADKLAYRLKQEERGDSRKGKWQVISKEILERSSKELELDPSQIEYVFKYEKKSAIDEILRSLSFKYYKSDRRIKNTIKKVIYSFGKNGNTIILGRGGSAITRDIEKAVHIRLIAPLHWRTEVIKKRFQLTNNKKARDYITDIDKKRADLRSEMAGGVIVDDTHYDIIFNAANFTYNQMVQIIIEVMEMRKMI